MINIIKGPGQEKRAFLDGRKWFGGSLPLGLDSQWHYDHVLDHVRSEFALKQLRHASGIKTVQTESEPSHGHSKRGFLCGCANNPNWVTLLITFSLVYNNL